MQKSESGTSLEQNKGRPTKNEQIEIQEKLRKYFLKNISATLAASETGLNIKTVCKYYNLWYDEITESNNQEFIQHQNMEREQTILSFDQLILEQYNLLGDIDVEIKKLKDSNEYVPRYYFRIKMDVFKSITNLKEIRLSFLQSELGQQKTPKEEIGEEMVREIVLYLLDTKDPESSLYTDEEIKFEIINLTKCNSSHSSLIFNKMKELGLDLCRDYANHKWMYNLGKFAMMRGYMKDHRKKNFKKINHSYPQNDVLNLRDDILKGLNLLQEKK